LDNEDDALIIISPLKGSPAEAAGLKPGDEILFVDATSTIGYSASDAVAIIRGPIGTSVTLTIMREGWTRPREFEIVREEINIPTVNFEMLSENVAHIELYQFSSHASRDFLDALRQASFARARGIILDLRGNPGGYLDVSVQIAGWFLPRGVLVVSQEGRNGIETEAMYASGNASLSKIPMVILIDEGSASASEILAGALRDHRKIPLVGKTSFGKGTVQEIQDLSDGSVLKLTVAHWVLPSGHVLEDAGLEPDYDVELTEEDLEKGLDPQLDKALEIMGEILDS
jgi:carboxyl-terminal processing protease